MAGATVLGRLSWLTAEAIETIAETPRTRTIVLDVPGWMGHRPGQHVDVRLTAEDGYQAQRSYSIASAPREGGLDLTVERIDDGEVSPYLVDDLVPGDAFELRGPIGGYFVWEADQAAPLLLVAGGSGIVPLMSVLRHRTAVGSGVPVRLLYSCRSLEDVIYRHELEQLSANGAGLEQTLTLTRVQPPGWQGYDRRIDSELIAEVVWPVSDEPLALVCGPTTFVEVAASALAELEYPSAQIKTERFGPTGG